jgi:hypothetical protein
MQGRTEFLHNPGTPSDIQFGARRQLSDRVWETGCAVLRPALLHCYPTLLAAAAAAMALLLLLVFLPVLLVA